MPVLSAKSILPIFQGGNKDLMLLQNTWSALLNPFLQRPQNKSIILQNISLSAGSNTIQTGLNRTLQGWNLVRQRSAASIYDNQDSNQSPTTTLILVSSAAVSVDIEVF